ncbi:MAG: hypothetical protein J3R72DRAFT_158418 [Linnemannia gamsii]|nr:MAG: hypothetical protein J3R72DRAFT_158418 [Linnemannia gamsii]
MGHLRYKRNGLPSLFLILITTTTTTTTTNPSNPSYPTTFPPRPKQPTHSTNHVSLQVQQEQDRLCCHHSSSDPSYLPQRAASYHPGSYQDDPRASTRGGYAQVCPESHVQHELQPSVKQLLHLHTRVVPTNIGRLPDTHSYPLHLHISSTSTPCIFLL